MEKCVFVFEQVVYFIRKRSSVMVKITSTKNKDILKGTNAADTLIVKHSQVTVDAGKGKDRINVNSGSKHKVYGEAGNDTIIVAAKAGSGSKFYGDDAKNKLTGKDTFTINGGKKNYFYGGKGVDTFNVNGGSTNYRDWQDQYRDRCCKRFQCFQKQYW